LGHVLWRFTQARWWWCGSTLHQPERRIAQVRVSNTVRGLQQRGRVRGIVARAMPSNLPWHQVTTRLWWLLTGGSTSQ
jgi:hypothetical protein